MLKIGHAASKWHFTGQRKLWSDVTEAWPEVGQDEATLNTGILTTNMISLSVPGLPKLKSCCPQVWLSSLGLFPVLHQSKDIRHWPSECGKVGRQPSQGPVSYMVATRRFQVIIQREKVARQWRHMPLILVTQEADRQIWVKSQSSLPSELQDSYC